jgi:protein phosphatase
LALVNVGDSRSYRFHDGQITQITYDHSLAEEMVRSGELTSAEAAVHPHRHILTRALGVSADVSVDLWRIQPVRGDRFLLCSDGLTNELDEDQIREVLSSVADPQKAADLLVQAARTHGGSDNITAVIVDVVVGEDGDASAPAVAAVSPDFAGPVDPGEGVAPTEAEEYPASVADEPAPSRRERRRARRRERRLARGRRLITFRTLLFVILLGAVIAGAYAAVRWYDINSYFVGVQNNELVIYQGRVGGFLWYHPVAVDRTGVTTADVPSLYLSELDAGVEETSVANARAYVSNLVTVKDNELNPSAASVPTTTVPVTTTTKGT